MQKYFRSLFFLLIFLSIASCNIYAPFETESSDEALVEAALSCLHDGDFDCAIEKYNALSDATLKEQKLCTTYIAKAGFTLNSFLNVITESQSTMLGTLAQSLIPWSVTRGQDAETAKTHCENYDTATGGNTGLGSMLKTISVYVDCATRMAKTDQYQAIDNNTTQAACEVQTQRPNHPNGILEPEDISRNANGDPTGVGGGGMCVLDINTCATDLQALDSNEKSELGDAGLGDIQGGLEGVPDEVWGAVVNDQRAAIRGMIPTR